MLIIECKQKDDRWWEARRGVPTASGFDSIITAKKAEYAAAAQTYAYQLIADWYDPNYGPQSQYETVSMIQGARMEPRARAFYEFERSVDVQEVGFVMSDCGRFGCSPDALVGDDGLLELKCPNASTHVKYVCGGKIPDEYKAQCHGQLIVTGRQWVDFVSYYPGLPHLLVRVEPDGFTDKLRGYLDRFWGEYQELRTKFERWRDAAIDGAIQRKGDQLDPTLKSFVA